VPIRLGLHYIQPEYLQSVKQMFSVPQSVGIAGGKENSALYFVGVSDSNHLIYLDPHFVQKSVPTLDLLGNFQQHIPEYQCPKMKRLALDRMCTSLALGFYIRDMDDYQGFKARIRKLAG
jgi:cysteine protease ATG4